MKRITGVAAAAAAALLLAGCSTISTAPDQDGLHYEDGPLSSRAFADCVPRSKREWAGPGDQFFAYPNNQREWKFGSPTDPSGNPVLDQASKGFDRPAETFVTRDSITMSGAGRVAFRLASDCQTLRKFHELIGARYQAWMDGDEVTAGWEEMVGVFVGGPVSTAIDRASQEFNYSDLYNNPSTKTAWEQRVLELLPELVNRQSDGDDVFFKDFSITLQRPEPPAEIRTLLLDTQKKIASANAQKADADAQVAVADAQAKQAQARVAIAKADAAAKAAEIAAYGGPEQYARIKAIEAGITPYPQPIVVGGGGTINAPK